MLKDQNPELKKTGSKVQKTMDDFINIFQKIKKNLDVYVQIKEKVNLNVMDLHLKLNYNC